MLRSYETRTGPKRILAIDGGGVRGALAVGLIDNIERALRHKLGRKDLVLADYFDLIGGTSTGAIIAAGLALGRSADQLAELYRTLGPRVFHGGGFRVPLIQPRFDPRKLEQVITEELGQATLGTADWKTGFAAIAKRVDTGSSWILTNCPNAKYWDGDPDENAREPDPAKRTTVPNRDYPLAKVVQASAAAPFYFDMVRIEVNRGDAGAFFDGAVTPHGNPALQLAMTAVAPAYGMGWEAAADKLMIVSVGTGQHRPMRPEWARRPARLAIWKAIHALTSLTYDTSQLAIAMLQWLGTSPQPWRINGEIGSLQGESPAAPLWTFVRYDAPLEARWLAEHMKTPPPAGLLPKLARLDDDRQVPALYEIGLKVGEKLVKPEHFPDAFDPPPIPV
ncbi:MAG TPA: patatin-like phospholipase family protein [Caulobacteraceae bacterium]|nr:patatin-like phospholipase family protein [Caulobacteraceae bacterium]